MQTARYILFDFDGTLADTLDLAFTLYNRIAGEYGCEPLKPEDKQIIAGGRPQDLLREYNMPMKKLGLITLRIRKDIHDQVPHMKPFEGIKEAVTALKERGYRLGIITSNARSNVGLFLENNGMDRLFDFVYSGKSIFGKDKVFRWDVSNPGNRILRFNSNIFTIKLTVKASYSTVSNDLFFHFKYF